MSEDSFDAEDKKKANSVISAISGNSDRKQKKFSAYGESWGRDRDLFGVG